MCAGLKFNRQNKNTKITQTSRVTPEDESATQCVLKKRNVTTQVLSLNYTQSPVAGMPRHTAHSRNEYT